MASIPLVFPTTSQWCPLEFHFGRPFRYQSRTVIMSGTSGCLSMTGYLMSNTHTQDWGRVLWGFPTSSTTMSSTPPPKKRFKMALRHGLDRSRDAILPTSGLSSPHPPPLPGTSTANGTLNVVRDRYSWFCFVNSSPLFSDIWRRYFTNIWSIL